MKLEEAIEMSEAILRDRQRYGECPGSDAIQLGIEALKRHRDERLLAVWYFPRPLPGETEN